MRLSKAPLARFNRLLLTLLLTLVWTGVTGRTLLAANENAPVAGEPTPERVLQAADTLDRLYAVMEDALRRMPRVTFDVAAVARPIGNNPAKALEWVRDQTWWVPYRGCLRGSSGVLQDRVGNSLDRAILLADLLRATGHEARLARATLSKAEAAKLMEKVRPLPKPAPADLASFRRQVVAELDQLGGPTVTAADRKLLRDAYDRGQVTMQRQMEDVVQRAVEQGAAISAALGEPTAEAIAAAEARERETALASLIDHYYVQYHEQDGRWTDLDPLLPDARPGAATPPAADTIAWDAAAQRWALPANLYHEVELRVVFEQWKDAGGTEVVPFTRVLRPVELAGRHVSLGHIPLKWPLPPEKAGQPDGAGAFTHAVAEVQEWVPALTVGDAVETQAGVSDDGELDAKPPLDAIAGVGRSVAKPIGAAADVFGAAAEPQSKPAASAAVLSAEWLEFRVRVPGQPERAVRRELFDLLGPAARAQVARSSARFPAPPTDTAARTRRGLAISGQTNILAFGATPSADFVADLSTRASLANRQAILKLLRLSARQTGVGLDAQVVEALGGLQNFPGPLYAFALNRHTWGARCHDVFLASPNVLCLHGLPTQSTSGELRLCRALDIVVNDVGVRPGVAGGSIRCRLQQGVVDTNVEWAALAGCGELVNTADAFVRSVPEDWKLIRSADDPVWKQSTLPAQAKARIEADLHAGLAALVPAAPPKADAEATISWWRIDPATGSTLGIGRHGWGVSAVERAALMRLELRQCLTFACLGLVIGGSGGAASKAVLAGLCVWGNAASAFGIAGGPFLGLASADASMLSGIGDVISLVAALFKLGSMAFK
jgi:hypothetical protein